MFDVCVVFFASYLLVCLFMCSHIMFRLLVGFCCVFAIGVVLSRFGVASLVLSVLYGVLLVAFAIRATNKGETSAQLSQHNSNNNNNNTNKQHKTANTHL